MFEKLNTDGKPLDASELVTAMYAASANELRKDWYGSDGVIGRQQRLVDTLQPADSVAEILVGVGNSDFLQAVSLFFMYKRRLTAEQTVREVQELPAVSSNRQALLDLPLDAYKKFEATVGQGFTRAAKFLRMLHICRVFDPPAVTPSLIQPKPESGIEFGAAAPAELGVSSPGDYAAFEFPPVPRHDRCDLVLSCSRNRNPGLNFARISRRDNGRSARRVRCAKLFARCGKFGGEGRRGLNEGARHCRDRTRLATAVRAGRGRRTWFRSEARRAFGRSTPRSCRSAWACPVRWSAASPASRWPMPGWRSR